MKLRWISLAGRGYRLKRVTTGKESSGSLWFSVGYPQLLPWHVPRTLQVLIFEKKRFLVLGDAPTMGRRLHQLQQLRLPDVYHGKGIHLSGQVLQRKTGKKAWSA
jgi:ribosomal protein L6P/L9E